MAEIINKELDYFKQDIDAIDFVLNLFAENAKIDKVKLSIKYGSELIDRIFEQLIKDELIYKHHDWGYIISLEGKLFYKKGGYKGAIKKEKVNGIIEWLKLIGIIIAAFGTIVSITFAVLNYRLDKKDMEKRIEQLEQMK